MKVKKKDKVAKNTSKACKTSRKIITYFPRLRSLYGRVVSSKYFSVVPHPRYLVKCFKKFTGRVTPNFCFEKLATSNRIPTIQAFLQVLLMYSDVKT
jgi:hypothetical protein